MRRGYPARPVRAALPTEELFSSSDRGRVDVGHPSPCQAHGPESGFQHPRFTPVVSTSTERHEFSPTYSATPARVGSGDNLPIGLVERDPPRRVSWSERRSSDSGTRGGYGSEMTRHFPTRSRCRPVGAGLGWCIVESVDPPGGGGVTPHRTRSWRWPGWRWERIRRIRERLTCWDGFVSRRFRLVVEVDLEALRSQ